MQLFEDIKIITLFSLAFFSIFLFTYKKGNRKSNFMLAAIYGFQALETLNSAFYRFSDFWIGQFPWVFYTTEFFFFLWGPAMYFFFKLSTDPDYEFKKRNLWHLAPAIIHTVFITFKFHIYSNEAKRILLEHGVMTFEEDFVIHFLRNASVIIYLVLSTMAISKSRIDNKNRRSWLVFF